MTLIIHFEKMNWISTNIIYLNDVCLCVSLYFYVEPMSVLRNILMTKSKCKLKYTIQPDAASSVTVDSTFEATNTEWEACTGQASFRASTVFSSGSTVNTFTNSDTPHCFNWSTCRYQHLAFRVVGIHWSQFHHRSEQSRLLSIISESESSSN